MFRGPRVYRAEMVFLVVNRSGRPKPVLCPWCDHPSSKVIDVRDEPSTIREQLDWTGGLWRKRECLKCTRRFTTEERVLGPTGSDARRKRPGFYTTSTSGES